MTPQQQAQQWLSNKCLILDTETTGLGEDDEIVEIGLIDSHGATLLSTLVKPLKPIPAEATAIHGITNAMVENAPSWPGVLARLCELISGQTVVIYNRDYDTRLIDQTNAAWEAAIPLDIERPEFACAMLAYAEFYGQSDSKRGGYKWQKLTEAVKQQGVDNQAGAHRAIFDCLATLRLIKAMAAGSRHHHSVQLGAQKAADILTRLFCADPDAITALVDHRVECSEEFATKTAATVGVDDSAYVVGMIGIINALIAPEVIAAIYDGGALTGFTVFNDTPKGESL